MSHNLLKGKRGIIFGALNDMSIAWKVAEKAVEEGATITLSNTPIAVRMGQVDALAVAIGSAHGFYKSTPRLDIDRLAEIHAATDVVLVLHGSSGIPHDMVREAIRNGIAKVNLATEIKDTFMRALKQTLQNSDEIDLRKVFPKATDSVVELLCDKYKMVGSAAE